MQSVKIIKKVKFLQSSFQLSSFIFFKYLYTLKIIRPSLYKKVLSYWKCGPDGRTINADAPLERLRRK